MHSKSISMSVDPDSCSALRFVDDPVTQLVWPYCHGSQLANLTRRAKIFWSASRAALTCWLRLGLPSKSGTRAGIARWHRRL